MEQDQNQKSQAPPEEKDELESSRMPFMAHLAELRTRLARSAIAVAIGFGICYPFNEKLLYFMVEPLIKVLPKGQRLVYTGLPEAFFTLIKISLLAGLLLALPVVFHQIWMFVAPGLYRKERKYALGFVIASSVLFIGGAVFGYGLVFPFGFKFFVGFESELLQPLPALKQYFSFSMRLLLAFGAVFELPIVMFFLARMGMVTDKFLRRNRKWAVLLIFIVGAIFTPPDVLTQFLMAVPLIVLFEISIWVVKIFGRKPAAQEEAEQPAPQEGGQPPSQES